MTVAEQTKEVVELAAGYVNEMVTALTPIAKQAYEIGLLVLRIDAASVLLFHFGCFVAFIFGARAWLRYYRSKNDFLDLEPAFLVFGTFAVAVVGVFSVGIFRVWIWVKLFSPELWLAHQAVETLLR